MWAEKQITLSEYTEARTIIERRIEDARRVLSTALPARVRTMLDSDDLVGAWANLDPAGRREVVQTLVHGWRVHPADLSAARRFQRDRLEVLWHG